MGYEPQTDFGTPASDAAASVTLTIDGRETTAAIEIRALAICGISRRR